MSKTALKPEGMSGVGPYSLAIKSDGVVYLSGQIHLDPEAGKLVDGDIATQSRQCLENLKRVLASDGLTFADVMKCTIFLIDMADFAEVNKVYADYMIEPFPARSTIQVAGLPLGARVEIEAIAHTSN